MRETVAERCLHSLSLSYPKTKTIYLSGNLLKSVAPGIALFRVVFPQVMLPYVEYNIAIFIRVLSIVFDFARDVSV